MSDAGTTDIAAVPTPGLERGRHGASIGRPLTRREGVLKVTGGARYAADNHPPGMLHAVMAVAAIARGRVAHLDVGAAKAHPGVVEVMTPRNVPKLAMSPDDKPDGFSFRLDVLQSDRVRYAQQPIAVVIAETLEAAAEGVALLAPRYEREGTPRVVIDQGETVAPKAVGVGSSAKEVDGDVAAGLAKADARIDAIYEIAPMYHNPLEPHAIVAEWSDGKLTLDTPSQGMAIAQGRLAGLLGIGFGDIFIRSPYLGGGFGSKGVISGPQVLGILAAKLVGKPVKLVMRREQMFGPVGHRGATRQTLKLGARKDGTLTALDHHTVSASSSFDDFFEPAGNASRHLYGSEAISSSHAGVRLDVGTPLFMRAPGEAPGSLALESAMDELAHALVLDPLDLRLKNYAEVEPMTGKPYSSKALRECYAQGAAAFGWADRPVEPRRMRDGNGLLVGWGVGTALFPALSFEGSARATIASDGKATVETGAHDMGQGAWTSMAQVAADTVGVAYEDLEFRMGTSDLPPAGIAGGSAGTATVGTAIQAAGDDAIKQLAALAVEDERSPLYGAGNAGVIARGGRLVRRDDESRSEAYAAILERAGKDRVVGNGKSSQGPTASSYALHAHGAVFAEVKIDPDLGQIRVTRLVGAFAAGTIINPRMVKSQYYGGMIWGVSMALHEHAAFDRRTGRPMNPNFGEYYVPVNADVPSIEAILVEEKDEIINALGIKGVGEIGITGTAGAIANAVWHATGVRVREIPITLDKLLG